MIRALFVAGLVWCLVGCGGAESQPPAEEQVETLYTCGMHPQVLQSGPGTCPICNMDLTPRRRADPTSGVVAIHPGVVQQMGVETAPVERTTVFRHIRTIGEVEVGEDQVSVVNLRFSGWVEKLRVDRTGDSVEAGQVLFDIYSPDLVAAQEQFLLALRSAGPDGQITRAARRRLELWDVFAGDIDAIVAAGEARRTLPIRAPQSGFVLHKDLIEGGAIEAGRDLYRIGNLTRIWVTAEVYEHDAPWIELGQPAQMELTHIAGEVMEGGVSYIYPTLNESSRTLTVRLEFDNPGVRLKPGMFATVYIQHRRVDGVVAIPTEAILHSGRRDLVFVALGGGRFEPREVRVGLVGDRRLTEIRSGLQSGEVVAVSGQFLIDSESQLSEALGKIGGGAPTEADDLTVVWSCPMHPEVLSADEGRCSECGMNLEERKGTDAELHQTYHAQRAQLGQYTCPMDPEVVQAGPGRCPQCGMFLEQVPEDSE